MVVSFFLRRCGLLAGGETLEQAIGQVDDATGGLPAYYMVNCTHPTEFVPALSDAPWTVRLGGLMPKAVAMETLSLCRLGHLEDGDPTELAGQMAHLSLRFRHAKVWGGCCGTDSRHIGAICGAVRAARAPG